MLFDENFKWTSKKGLVNYICHSFKEFSVYRDLKPLKILILGPPLIGKS